MLNISATAIAKTAATLVAWRTLCMQSVVQPAVQTTFCSVETGCYDTIRY